MLAIKRRIIWVTLLLGLALLIHFALYSECDGYWYTESINEYVNNFHDVDKNCISDTDCKLEQTTCYVCSLSAESVNEDYAPYCPLPQNYKCGCIDALPDYIGCEAYCDQGTCKARISPLLESTGERIEDVCRKM